MTMNSDKSRLIAELGAVMDAFNSITGRHVEVVLHDLAAPDSSVLKIINGHISGRKPGSPLLSAPENDRGFLGLLNVQSLPLSPQPVVFPGYATRSPSGKPLHSATVLFKDEQGSPMLSLCFNVDNGAIDTAKEALSALLPQQPADAQDAALSLEDKLNEIIRLCIPPAGQIRTGATKKEKVEIVRHMQERGMFMVRGGVEKAASVLGVTRYTVYNYLDEIRKNPANP